MNRIFTVPTIRVHRKLKIQRAVAEAKNVVMCPVFDTPREKLYTEEIQVDWLKALIEEWVKFQNIMGLAGSCNILG